MPEHVIAVRAGGKAGRLSFILFIATNALDNRCHPAQLDHRALLDLANDRRSEKSAEDSQSPASAT